MVPSDADSRSIQVDDSLLRGMTREATTYTLSRPLVVLAYAALAGAFAFNAVSLARTEPESARAGTLAFTLFLLAAFAVVSLVYVRAAAKRAIASTAPVGSTVRATVGAERMLLVTRRGASDLAYSSFRGMRVGRHALLLRVRDVSGIVAVPRALFDDADVALLRSRIGGPGQVASES